MLRSQKILHLEFFLLIVTFPFQIVKFFPLSFSFIEGRGIDYLFPSLYLSDLLIFVLFATDFIIFGKKNFIQDFIVKLKKGHQGLCSQKGRIYLFFFLYFLWALLSTIFSVNFSAGGFRLLKLLEFLLLVAWIEGRIQKQNFAWILLGLLLPLLVEIPIIFGEWYQQSSLGLQFLGEWKRTLATPGLAKVYLGGQSFLRPYATFPHPNALAGYLDFCLIILAFFILRAKSKILIRQMRDCFPLVKLVLPWMGPAKEGPAEFVPQKFISARKSRGPHFADEKSISFSARKDEVVNFTSQRTIWQKGRSKVLAVFTEDGVIFKLLSIVLFVFGIWSLILTFSRSAWAAFFLALVLNFIIFWLRKKRRFAVRQIKIRPRTIFLSALMVLGGVFFGPYIAARFISMGNVDANSWMERAEYIYSAIAMIVRHPLFGVGLNNFINAQVAYFGNLNFNFDLYQPAHLSPLLIIAESGIAGFLFFGLAMGKLITGVVRRTFSDRDQTYGRLFLALWVVVFFISFFDHYFYTLQQGALLFWLLAGLSLVYLSPTEKREKR
ncbi:hypothetical protein COS81_03415 [candidate division WWE3 bacterium CG06_land_8_20_14_3_00_42_16]|uniref:O-antigen ligase-related domain-containing protein n=3 Tax=Katanobacteria TaxID=422282 RepID=A0A2M7AMI2_UNCKA|nr:MAG: hypothetical protein COS81_03415 [candidate division WWE3 bacterium CG06_land_8_20_14_3_00_42_16]PJA37516.1 MAG: hypothetical protein CO181_03220 [candidate division WWE3 bacterium CG_4_9_14_3_um_filter_43_9]PJC68803.1 MAG: hypothetical protein CO015_02710 [candidate division WWE3 bacterium CG_4_8_14_3_um_filter_42_11]